MTGSDFISGTDSMNDLGTATTSSLATAATAIGRGTAGATLYSTTTTTTTHINNNNITATHNTADTARVATTAASPRAAVVSNTATALPLASASPGLSCSTDTTARTSCSSPIHHDSLLPILLQSTSAADASFSGDLPLPSPSPSPLRDLPPSGFGSAAHLTPINTNTRALSRPRHRLPSPSSAHSPIPAFTSPAFRALPYQPLPRDPGREVMTLQSVRKDSAGSESDHGDPFARSGWLMTEGSPTPATVVAKNLQGVALERHMSPSATACSVGVADSRGPLRAQSVRSSAMTSETQSTQSTITPLKIGIPVSKRSTPPTPAPTSSLPRPPKSPITSVNSYETLKQHCIELRAHNKALLEECSRLREAYEIELSSRKRQYPILTGPNVLPETTGVGVLPPRHSSRSTGNRATSRSPTGDTKQRGPTSIHPTNNGAAAPGGATTLLLERSSKSPVTMTTAASLKGVATLGRSAHELHVGETPVIKPRGSSSRIARNPSVGSLSSQRSWGEPPYGTATLSGMTKTLGRDSARRRDFSEGSFVSLDGTPPRRLSVADVGFSTGSMGMPPCHALAAKGPEGTQKSLEPRATAASVTGRLSSSEVADTTGVPIAPCPNNTERSPSQSPKQASPQTTIEPACPPPGFTPPSALLDAAPESPREPLAADRQPVQCRSTPGLSDHILDLCVSVLNRLATLMESTEEQRSVLQVARVLRKVKDENIEQLLLERLAVLGKKKVGRSSEKPAARASPEVVNQQQAEHQLSRIQEPTGERSVPSSISQDPHPSQSRRASPSTNQAMVALADVKERHSTTMEEAWNVLNSVLPAPSATPPPVEKNSRLSSSRSTVFPTSVNMKGGGSGQSTLDDKLAGCPALASRGDLSGNGTGDEVLQRPSTARGVNPHLAEGLDQMEEGVIPCSADPSASKSDRDPRRPAAAGTGSNTKFAAKIFGRGPLPLIRRKKSTSTHAEDLSPSPEQKFAALRGGGSPPQLELETNSLRSLCEGSSASPCSHHSSLTRNETAGTLVSTGGEERSEIASFRTRDIDQQPGEASAESRELLMDQERVYASLPRSADRTLERMLRDRPGSAETVLGNEVGGGDVPRFSHSPVGQSTLMDVNLSRVPSNKSEILNLENPPCRYRVMAESHNEPITTCNYLPTPTPTPTPTSTAVPTPQPSTGSSPETSKLPRMAADTLESLKSIPTDITFRSVHKKIKKKLNRMDDANMILGSKGVAGGSVTGISGDSRSGSTAATSTPIPRERSSSDSSRSKLVHGGSNVPLGQGKLQPHDFQLGPIQSGRKCLTCQEKLWRPRVRELTCVNCGIAIHQRCLPTHLLMLSELIPGQACQVILPPTISVCIQAVEQYGGYEMEGIYRKSGPHAQIKHLCRRFEAGKIRSVKDLVKEAQKGEVDISVVTSVLRTYLRELPDPLVPHSSYGKLCEAYSGSQSPEDAGERLSRVLKVQLSGQTFMTLTVLLAHLHRISQHSDINLMTARNLAVVFGPTLLRPPVEGSNDPYGTDFNVMLEFMIEYARCFPAVQVEFIKG